MVEYSNQTSERAVIGTAQTHGGAVHGQLNKEWGATLNASGMVQGSWDQETAEARSINWIELKIVHLGLLHFALKNKSVMIRSDNLATVYNLVKQGGLIHRTYAFWHGRSSSFVTNRTSPSQFSTTVELNVIADQLSRSHKAIPTGWTLNKKVFRAVVEELGKPGLDLFATSLNNQLPIYVSPCPDPNALALDAEFCTWCSARKEDPMQASVPVVANFLVHLFQRRPLLAVSTIRGYRSAIASTIPKGYLITNSKEISSLLKSLGIDRPVTRVFYPKWNLQVVLNYLTKDPFENISLENLTVFVFIPFRNIEDDIKPVHLSKWIVDLVKRAHRDTDQDTVTLSKVTAHEIRAIVTSWAAYTQPPF